MRRAADGAAKLRGFFEGHGDDLYPALLDFLDESFVLRTNSDDTRQTGLTAAQELPLGSLRESFRCKAEHFEHELRAGKRGNAADIKGRRDLDDIGADNVHSAQSL
jgi:hypothetical protein